MERGTVPLFYSVLSFGLSPQKYYGMSNSEYQFTASSQSRPQEEVKGNIPNRILAKSFNLLYYLRILDGTTEQLALKLG